MVKPFEKAGVSTSLLRIRITVYHRFLCSSLCCAAAVGNKYDDNDFGAQSALKFKYNKKNTMRMS